jgi:hypothetical protein
MNPPADIGASERDYAYLFSRLKREYIKGGARSRREAVVRAVVVSPFSALETIVLNRSAG